MKKYLFVFALVSACATPMPEQRSEKEPLVFSEDRSTHQLVAANELQWTMLNPARGDASPQAATIWGDRSKNVPTGFLVKFVNGFSSPPHIHNVSYRGVVIEGSVHNDDPTAASMWMQPGSFWTQPAGEPHITSANADTNIAFIEIDAGPYLVKPVGEAFDNGERPVNVDARNLVWRQNSEGFEESLLWGGAAAGDDRGVFIKIPAGFKGVFRAQSEMFRAVVITGDVLYGASETSLKPGSFFSSGIKFARHEVGAAETSVIYVRSNQPLQLLKATSVQ